MVAANALRNAATRSAMTPGGIRNGRPSTNGANAASITSRSSPLLTRSGANGTPGSSASFSAPYCTMAFAVLSRSQSGRVDRIELKNALGWPSSSRRSMANHHGGLGARRAQPVEPDGVVARLLGAEQRLEWRVVLNEPDHGAVLVGIVVEKIRGGHAAGTRHVAHDHRRIARDVPAQEAGHRAGE